MVLSLVLLVLVVLTLLLLDILTNVHFLSSLALHRIEKT